MNHATLKKGEGCHSDDSFAKAGFHEYSDWECTVCHEMMCWNCAVKCTDDSTGEGPVTCPHCGADQGFYPSDLYYIDRYGE